MLIKKRKEFHQNFFSNQKVISIEDQRSTYKNFTILTDDGTHKPLFNEHSDANGEVFDDKKTSLSWETFQEIYFNKKHN